MCWETQGKKAAEIEEMENTAREILQEIEKIRGWSFRFRCLTGSEHTRCATSPSDMGHFRSSWKWVEFVARPWRLGTWFY